MAFLTWLLIVVSTFAVAYVIHFAIRNDEAQFLNHFSLRYYWRCVHVLAVSIAVLYLGKWSIALIWSLVINVPIVMYMIEGSQNFFEYFLTLLKNPQFQFIFGGTFQLFISTFQNDIRGSFDKIRRIASEYIDVKYELTMSCEEANTIYVVNYVTQKIEEEKIRKEKNKSDFHLIRSILPSRSGLDMYKRYQKVDRSTGGGFMDYVSHLRKAAMELKTLPDYAYNLNFPEDMEFSYVPKQYPKTVNDSYPGFMYKETNKSYKLKLSPERESPLGKSANNNRNSDIKQPVDKIRTLILCDSDDHEILQRFHQESIIELSINKNNNLLSVYSLKKHWSGPMWQLTKPLKTKRSKESLILDQDLLDELIDDACDFFNPETKKNVYEKLNIPYRRGYLLYGPPGCGKSSFAHVIASELNLNLLCLSLSEPSLDDSSLNELLRDALPNSLILFEDVDAVRISTHDRAGGASSSDTHKSDDGNKGGLTFSGLLNAIDGVTAQEGSIFMMTTNHIEKLDPALIRPGRVDKKVEVSRATKDQMRRMFLRFFPECNEEAYQFANYGLHGKIAMADLQGFLRERYAMNDGPENCLRNIRDLQNNVRNDPVSTQRNVISLYSFLERLNLEDYTPLFERYGILNTSQLNVAISIGDISLRKLTKLSFRLRYDNVALKLFKMILNSNDDAKEVIEKEKGLVDIADIRNRFFKFFKTANEIRSGEPPPSLRRTFSVRNEATRGSSNEMDGEISPPPVMATASGIRRSLSTGSRDSAMEICYAEPIDQDELNDISEMLEKSFTPTSSTPNRPTISNYNLSRLLRNYPNRPKSCLRAVDGYMNFALGSLGNPCKDRSSSSFSYKDMSPSSFLKRAGLSHLIPTFSRKFPSIKTVRELFKKLREMIPKDEAENDISDDDDDDDDKGGGGGGGRGGGGRGHPGRGGPQPGRGGGGRGGGPTRPARYVPGLIGLNIVANPGSSGPPGSGIPTSRGSSSDGDDNNDDTTDDDLILSSEEKSILAEIIHKIENTPNGYYLDFSLYDIPRVTSEFISYYSGNSSNDGLTESSLEPFAFSFALRCADSKGLSRVSLIEIKKFLSKQLTPLLALQNVKTLLIEPQDPFNDASASNEFPAKKPSKAKAKAPGQTQSLSQSQGDESSFVYKWLKSIDESLVKFASNFTDQNLVTEKDFIICGVLEDAILKEEIKVTKLGDRRKIMHWHAGLCKSPPDYPDEFDAATAPVATSSRGQNSSSMVSLSNAGTGTRLRSSSGGRK